MSISLYDKEENLQDKCEINNMPRACHAYDKPLRGKGFPFGLIDTL